MLLLHLHHAFGQRLELRLEILLFEGWLIVLSVGFGGTEVTLASAG